MSDTRWRCAWCDARTTSYTGYCQRCKSLRHHAYKRVEREGWIVDTAGGGWWVWSARGEVLVTGRDTKADAMRALATGDTVTSWAADRAETPGDAT